MSSVSGTRGAEFQLAGSGSLGFGVAAGAAMGVGRSGLAEPLGGWDPCGAEWLLMNWLLMNWLLRRRSDGGGPG